MLFSKGCSYAIRAALLVAVKEAREGRKFIPIRELAEELDLSFHFLTKILQILTEAEIMESFRGPNGGIGLAHEASKISLIQIISAIDGMSLFSECALGLPDCGEAAPCPLHESWSKRRNELRLVFEKTTLATLSGDLSKSNYRH